MKQNITRKLIPFNKTKPEDVILLEWLNSKPNATEYIKELIREDIASKS